MNGVSVSFAQTLSVFAEAGVEIRAGSESDTVLTSNQELSFLSDENVYLEYVPGCLCSTKFLNVEL